MQRIMTRPNTVFAVVSRVLLYLLVTSVAVLDLQFGADAALHHRPCHFPAIYNFGDSNSDTGGIAAAFYPMAAPSGDTFFHRPAGRASDGRLMIDFIAEHFGLPHLSAYLDSVESSYRHGANFATGGATIRRQNESWFLNSVSPFPLEIQTAQFNQFKSRTTSYLRKNNLKEKNFHRKRLPRTKDFSKALYIFDIGQNDLAAGFRSLSYDHVKRMKPSIPDIVDQLVAGVQHLYDQGGRTFWIHNTGPIGCLPFTVHGVVDPSPGLTDKHGCVRDQNEMAIEFNRRLKKRVNRLRHELTEATLTYVDLYAAKYELLTNAEKYGFENGFTICCGADYKGKHLWCGNRADFNGTKVFAAACKDPSSVVSWDGVHYTEAANHWIVKRLIDGSFSDVPLTHACRR